MILLLSLLLIFLKLILRLRESLILRLLMGLIWGGWKARLISLPLLLTKNKIYSKNNCKKLLIYLSNALQNPRLLNHCNAVCPCSSHISASSLVHQSLYNLYCISTLLLSYININLQLIHQVINQLTAWVRNNLKI